jgi:quercetin dioxygenase-like cupin family protein
MEENPKATMDALVSFLGGNGNCGLTPTPPESATGSSALPQMLLTPDEVRANQTGSEQIGSSGLAGVRSKVISGDPSKAGFYTIILSVPPNTTIPAHSHRDERMATVVSGTWQFGYGDRFDEQALKRLPPGSVYSEPAAAIISHAPVRSRCSWRSPAWGRRILAMSIRRTLRRAIRGSVGPHDRVRPETQ